jgi:hypothetical protein
VPAEHCRNTVRRGAAPWSPSPHDVSARPRTALSACTIQKRIYSSLLDGAGTEGPRARSLRGCCSNGFCGAGLRRDHDGCRRRARGVVGRQPLQVLLEQAAVVRRRCAGRAGPRAHAPHARPDARAGQRERRAGLAAERRVSRAQRRAARLLPSAPAERDRAARAGRRHGLRWLCPGFRGEPRGLVARIRAGALPGAVRFRRAPLRARPRLPQLRARRRRRSQELRRRRPGARGHRAFDHPPPRRLEAPVRKPRRNRC